MHPPAYMGLSVVVHSLIIQIYNKVKQKKQRNRHTSEQSQNKNLALDGCKSQSSNHRVEREARADKQIGAEGAVAGRVCRPHGVSSFIHGKPESVCMKSVLRNEYGEDKTTNDFKETRKLGGKTNLAVQPTKPVRTKPEHPNYTNEIPNRSLVTYERGSGVTTKRNSKPDAIWFRVPSTHYRRLTTTSMQPPPLLFSPPMPLPLPPLLRL